MNSTFEKCFFALSILARAESDINGISHKKTVYKLSEITGEINILGRCAVTDNGLNVDWSASGFEFVADCKDFVKATVTSSHNCRLNVYVDGGELRAIDVTAGTKSYVIASGLEKGVHEFRVVKSSMVEYATTALAVTVESLEIYGELGEAEAREHLIEFVGDSITCGVGAVAGTTEAYSELSYAYLTAGKLNADYSLVSVSGIGAGKSTERHGNTLMGDVYPLTNYYRSKTEKYSTERKADLVVINLNTNDKGSFAQDQKDAFLAKVEELIGQVKSIHGEDVKIIWVMGMMSPISSGYLDLWTAQYFASLGGESAGYYYLVASETNRQGGASHPIASAHEKMANQLEAFIIDKGILN